MTNHPNLAAIRRQYGTAALNESEMNVCPIAQTRLWLNQAVEVETDDPTAMVLSTVDLHMRPDARTVLLKEIQENGFVFFTHYGSVKGEQIKANPFVALTFYWSVLARQIRVRGTTSLLSETESDLYFASRPYLSQLSACASLQSQPISDRASLETAMSLLKKQYPEGAVPRPADWGGYIVIPYEIEFWQGRDNRLSDRIRYTLQEKIWHKTRLAP